MTAPAQPAGAAPLDQTPLSMARDKGVVSHYGWARSVAHRVHSVEQLVDRLTMSPGFARTIDVPDEAGWVDHLAEFGDPDLTARIRDTAQDRQQIQLALGLAVEGEWPVVDGDWDVEQVDLVDEVAQAGRLVHGDRIGCYGPVGAQLERATCVAHAFSDATACVLRQHGDVPELSAQHLYWRCKQADGDPNPGTTLQRGAEMAAEGIWADEVWPYDGAALPGNESHDPPPPGGLDADTHHLPDHWSLDHTDWQALIRLLDDGHPVVVGVRMVQGLWTTLDALRSGRVQVPDEADLVDAEVQGHAVLVCGYVPGPTDGPDGWDLVIRNSFGTGWASESAVGTPGYGLLPVRYLTGYGAGAWATGW